MQRKKLNVLPKITFVDDGSQLSQKLSSKMLSQFLKIERAKKIKVWDKGSQHFGFVGAKGEKKRKVKITFPRKMVYRAKKIPNTNRKHARYDIVGKKIGEGAYGSVHDIDVTLSHLKDGSMRENQNHDYVIKFQDHQQKNDPANATNEARMGKIARHLKMKWITYRKNKQGKIIESYLVSRKLKEKLLVDVIINDIKETSVLTTKDRFKLTINILFAYIDQLYDRKIVHRDIKSANMMVEKNKDINFFDVEFGRLFDESDDKGEGTALFAAPECFVVGVTQDEKSDFYSLGIILLQLWRTLDCAGNEEAIRAAAINKEERIFKNLGLKIDDISEDVKLKIFSSLNRLITYDKNKRTHPLEVLDSIQNIYLDYKLAQVPNKYSKSLIEANQLARKVNTQLHQIKCHKKTSAPSVLKTVMDDGFNQLQAIQLDEKWDNTEQDNVRHLILKEFIDVINVRSFKEINTKDKPLSIEDVKQKAEKIISEFESNIKFVHKLANELHCGMELIKLYEQNDKSELQTLLENLYDEIAVLLDKIDRADMTFDDREEINCKCDKKLLIIQEELNKFTMIADTNPQLADVLTYKKIIKRLQVISSSDESSHFKKEMGNLISDHIHDSNASTLKTSRQDILDMITILESKNDSASLLRQNVQEKIDSMHHSLFSNSLQKKLRKAMVELSTFVEQQQRAP